MARRKPITRPLEELPGLFDNIEIDLSREDATIDLVAQHRRNQRTPNRPIRSDMEIDPADLSRYTELRFISFGSGSSGNCAFIGVVGEGGILIDAGIDEDTVMAALKTNCINPADIHGIILTHDHSDHVRGAYSILRRNRHMRLYCTPRTLDGILRRHSISRRIKEYHHPIYKEFEFSVGPFTITPFETSHDGTDNVGFSISVADRHFVVATDMGRITERADFYIRQANMLMIESNYDSHMLTVGPYPEYLKARIRGDRGHMDNAVSAAYLADIYSPALTDIYLCHLSQDNNTPETAIAESTRALSALGLTVGDASGSPASRQADIRLSILPRHESSPLFIHRFPRK